VKPAPLTVLIDTREQTPCPFPAGVLTERAYMKEGDMTTRALWNLCRIERKNPEDFASSLTHGRERLDREIERLKAYPHRCIVVEADLADYYTGKVRSQVHINAIVGSMASMQSRHGIPVLFLHSPILVGRFIAGVFRRLEEIHGQSAGTE